MLTEISQIASSYHVLLALHLRMREGGHIVTKILQIASSYYVFLALHVTLPHVAVHAPMSLV